MEGYIGGIALPTNVTLGKCIPSMLCVVDVYLTVTTKYIDMIFFCLISSRGGLEVEQWSDNRTLSISVDQSPLGACMIIWYQWTRYVMYVLDVCYMCV